MHHHGYLWTGPKGRFDQDALRRPPHPEPPPAGSRPELIRRYREVAAEFSRSDLPPLETAYWLVKPPTMVRGTWPEPQSAAAWLGDRLAEYAPRFAFEAQREAGHLATLVTSAAERLGTGTDTSFGFYLERPSYLCLALVTCSPNCANPDLRCPLGE